MSLQDMSKSPIFTNEMQTDENTRKYMAAFFGDPEARSFVQQSGGIQGAVQKLDGQAAAPAPVPTFPSMPSFPAAQSRDEWAAANPQAAAIPARPTVDLDAMTPGRRALTAAFLGLSKFGGTLAGQEHTFADEFLGNTLRQREAQKQYDINAPTMKREAVNREYGAYLDQMYKRGKLTSEQIKALRENRLDQEQRDSILREFYNKAANAWATDPRYVGNKDSFRRAASSMGYGLNIDPTKIDEIMNTTPQTAQKYPVTFNKEGVPLYMTGPDGRQIFEKDIPTLNDPLASKSWEAATGGYNRAIEDQQKIMQMRGASFANSRFLPITDPKTGITRWVTGPDAVSFTTPGQGGAPAPYAGGPPAEVNKGRQRAAMFMDVTQAADMLHATIPERPLSMDEVGRIAAAVREYHGPVEEAIKSKYLQGMQPDAAQLASSILAMRDQIILLPTMMGVAPSDARVQSLWNAIPSAADLQNPVLARKKMGTVYRMIKNLQQGIPANASPEYFGLKEAERGEVTNTFPPPPSR